MSGPGVAIAGALYAVAALFAWRGWIPLRNVGVVRRGDMGFRLTLAGLVAAATVFLVVSLLVP